MDDWRQLDWVHTHADPDQYFKVGVNNVQSIELGAFGRGISGYYDVIRVRFELGEWREHPAHSCFAWGGKD